jgi:hypothetical protein
LESILRETEDGKQETKYDVITDLTSIGTPLYEVERGRGEFVMLETGDGRRKI